MRGSLRRRLLATFSLLALAAFGIGAAFVYQRAHAEIDALLDAQLVQAGRLIAERSPHEIEEARLEADELARELPYDLRLAWLVWADDGALLARSAGAPPMPAAEVEAALRGGGAVVLRDVRLDGRLWRLHGVRDRERGLVVAVVEDHALREHVARRVALTSMLPLLVVLPLLALTTAWMLRTLLAPLERVGTALARRGADSLEDLDVTGTPVEVQPLVERLNALLRDVRSSIARERRFASNAAHELRNPLAALRARAEAALLEGGPDTARVALERIVASSDRLARLVGQLLTLARIEEHAATATEVDLRRVATEVVAELAPDAAGRDCELALEVLPEAAGPVIVRGNAELLRAALRNLVDNALRHGRDVGQVIVRLQCDADACRISVVDDGAPLDPELLPRLGERFARGSRDVDGSGLGLALVKRIAEWHGGTLRLSPGAAGRGLEATVDAGVRIR